MRNILVLVSLVFAVSPILTADDLKITIDDPGFRLKIEFDDNCKLFRKHGDIIVQSEDEEEVAISEDGELWVNGHKVRVRRSERKLLIEYHELAMSLLDRCEDIAEQGVKLGLKGAVLGIKAATGVFKILLPGYSTEDYEKDVEKAAKKLEKKAEKIEDKGDKLQAMSEQLQDIHDELREKIKELDDLDWF